MWSKDEAKEQEALVNSETLLTQQQASGWRSTAEPGEDGRPFHSVWARKKHQLHAKLSCCLPANPHLHCGYKVGIRKLCACSRVSSGLQHD
jgi:hypothetical protein